MRCVECSEEPDQAARGWRAFTDGEAGDEAVLVYCSACAEREFGPAPRVPPTCRVCEAPLDDLVGWRGAPRSSLRRRGNWADGLRLEVFKCSCGEFGNRGWTPTWGTSLANHLDGWRREIIAEYETRTR
jgi:hypothetical protein